MVLSPVRVQESCRGALVFLFADPSAYRDPALSIAWLRLARGNLGGPDSESELECPFARDSDLNFNLWGQDEQKPMSISPAGPGNEPENVP